MSSPRDQHADRPVDESDEDALTWSGDRDPSLFVNPEPLRKPARVKRSTRAEIAAAPDAADAESEPGTADADADTEDAARPASAASGAVLVCLGIFAGIYLIYTIGWIASLRRLTYGATSILEADAFTAQQVLGIVGPAAWFGAVLWFTRSSRPAVRLIWLLVGAVLLVPWSYLMGS